MPQTTPVGEDSFLGSSKHSRMQTFALQHGPRDGEIRLKEAAFGRPLADCRSVA